MITILASIAQQESASISQNVRMGIQFGFQEGRGRLNYSVFLGYKRGEKPGSYEIVPDQANVVRRIYREYLEGFSPSMIADGLTADGIRTPAGGANWFPSSVRRILENEKYCGDLLMQKYYVKDFLTHKCVKNEGERPRYYVEDDHDPIVPRAVFCQVQGEIKCRAALVQDPGMLRFGKRMALSGRLVCGRCGRILKRYESGEKSDWRCRQRAREKKSEVVSRQPGCGLRIVGERDVQSAVVEAFNRLPGRRDELIRLEERLLTGEIGRIDACLKALTDHEVKIEERLDQWAAAGDGAAGSEGEVDFLKGRITEIREQKNALYAERADHASREMQVRMLLELVDEMCGRGRKVKVKSGACRDWDDFFRRTAYKPPEDVIRDGKMVRFENGLTIRYIDKVILVDNGCKVVFKAGIEV